MTITAPNEVDLRHRRIAVVDVENLVGGSMCVGPQLRITLDNFDRAAGVTADDLVFVAAAPQLAFDCRTLRPDASVWCARGRDGAELRLMSEVSVDWVATRADELIIGSGDHLFVDYALAARARGVRVRVVGRHESIHHLFWVHGFEVIELDDLIAVAA
jgi:hypothetical protein